ncbi:anthrone oxygenase family protein [Oceaniglobus roseus]|uniref:anthrone oxygenase family protein n=1 Tax=Oceaniglobus roseus TaxID=1737570 RepID=UPI000C7F57F9|nr:anthrone oxygenase family protein [Kandeliimicrobium roseum]
MGCCGVTVFFNVPINEALEGLNLSDDATRARWTGTCLPRWTFWNTVRTLACGVPALLPLFGLPWMTRPQTAAFQVGAR